MVFSSFENITIDKSNWNHTYLTNPISEFANRKNVKYVYRMIHSRPYDTKRNDEEDTRHGTMMNPFQTTGFAIGPDPVPRSVD